MTIPYVHYAVMRATYVDCESIVRQLAGRLETAPSWNSLDATEVQKKLIVIGAESAADAFAAIIAKKIADIDLIVADGGTPS